MNGADMLESVVVAAVTSAVVSFAVALASATVGFLVAERRLRTENRLDSGAEAAVAALLRQKPCRMQSFEKIKYHLAGFEDDELRKVLVRCGAIRWFDMTGKEFWGELRRNRAWLSEEDVPEGMLPRRLPSSPTATPARVV